MKWFHLTVHNNLIWGTNKNELRVQGKVEPQVGKTRYGTLLIRVGQRVISLSVFRIQSNESAKEKRVIELDIEKCFDKISHTAIMDNLIAPQGMKKGIFRCLKAGVNPEFPEQGTPQGGVGVVRST